MAVPLVCSMVPLSSVRTQLPPILIVADVPMSEMFGYNTDLRSMTGGIGVFSYEFSRYEQAPGDVQKKEVEARASKDDQADA